MPIDFDFASQLTDYAKDAYISVCTDAELQKGYARPSGKVVQALSRVSWLTENDYQPIVNPLGSSLEAMYWGIVATTSDSVIVALRGTASLYDISIDASGGSVDAWGRVYFPFAEWQVGSTATSVHRNFLTTYQTISNSVRTIVKTLFDGNSSLTKLYVTGHSLGGALATICALDLATGLRSTDPRVPSPRLYTYASPKVGDQAFASLVDEHLTEAYRIADAADWVPGVPETGETVAYQTWVARGKVGPEPTRYASYVHVDTAVAVTNPGYFPFDHYLDAYYRGCLEQKPNQAGQGLHPLDPVTSLVVRIKTADRLGAGTDADVYVSLLDVNWGPLDHAWSDDFERGSTGAYDLFAMFPSKIPANPTCGQITEVWLIMDYGYFDLWTELAWEPEWIEVEVNGVSSPKVCFSGALSWSTSLSVRANLQMTQSQA